MKSALLGVGIASVLALSSFGATPALAAEADPTSPPADPQQQVSASPETAAETPTPTSAPSSTGSPDPAGTSGPAVTTDPNGDAAAASGPDAARPTTADATAPSSAPATTASASPSATPTEATSEGRVPTAPRSLRAVYGVDAAGDAHVTVSWTAPDDLGVIAGSDDPEGGQGRSTFLFRVTLAMASASPQTAYLEADEVYDDDGTTVFTRLFDVPAGDGLTWTASVEASNDSGQTWGPRAIISVHSSSTPAPRPPSAPRSLEADYGVDADGTAHVSITWSAPDDLGVVGQSGDPDGGLGTSTFLYRGTLAGGSGSPQSAIVAVEEVVDGDTSYLPGGTLVFAVPAGDGLTWMLTVEASNDAGQTWGPAASTTVSSPPGGTTPPGGSDLIPITITSATASGHHPPAIAVTWHADADDRIAGWLVTVVDLDATMLGDAVVVATRVPASAASVTLRGGESITELGLTVGGHPLPNSARLAVVVVAVSSEFELLGVSAPAYVTTATATPAAPVPPTGPDSGGVTASVADGVITVALPGTKPGAWVYGYAFSTPVGLGWAQVTAAGTASWSLAAANLPAGAHQVVVMDEAGEVVGSAGFSLSGTAIAPTATGAVSASGAVTAAAASTGSVRLAQTGAEAEAPFGAAALLLLAGIALVTGCRIRSARRLA